MGNNDDNDTTTTAQQSSDWFEANMYVYVATFDPTILIVQSGSVQRIIKADHVAGQLIAFAQFRKIQPNGHARLATLLRQVMPQNSRGLYFWTQAGIFIHLSFAAWDRVKPLLPDHL